MCIRDRHEGDEGELLSERWHHPLLHAPGHVTLGSDHVTAEGGHVSAEGGHGVGYGIGHGTAYASQ
eukprot:3115851-Rhodomonas_salina.1